LALRRAGVEEWSTTVVLALYDGAQSHIQSLGQCKETTALQ